jgi:hypothetical protein
MYSSHNFKSILTETLTQLKRTHNQSASTQVRVLQHNNSPPSTLNLKQQCNNNGKIDQKDLNCHFKLNCDFENRPSRFESETTKQAINYTHLATGVHMLFHVYNAVTSEQTGPVCLVQPKSQTNCPKLNFPQIRFAPSFARHDKNSHPILV